MKTNLFKNTTAAIAALFIAIFALPTAAQAQGKEAYAVLNGTDKTFNLYYDDNKETHTEGTVYALPASGKPEWSSSDQIKQVTTVTFDKSMADYHPVTTASWFSKFYKLTAIIGIENLKTDQVTDMSYMFNSCSSLRLLDVSGFDTKKVTNMDWMFAFCRKLKRIYCNDAWTCEKSNYMFKGIENLKGAAEKFDENKGVEMANPTTGYFTKKGTMEAYAVLNAADKTFTFYYDGKKPTHTEGNIYDLTSGKPEWQESGMRGRVEPDAGKVTTVIFDSSMADCRPVSTAFWFADFEKLTTINGMENLKTDEVGSMSHMFTGCSNLTALDLSTFNTEKVTAMHYMFHNCSGLKSLNVSKFNTGKVTNMSSMFENCRVLPTLDILNFNTENVTNMNAMFTDCRALTKLDVTKFNTSKVTDMGRMFRLCARLTSLDVTGFNTENVTDMFSMFDNCQGLTSIDVSKLNTSKVEYMSNMFNACISLTSLDVSNFNTENAKEIKGMFAYCQSLTSIDLSNFNTAKVKYIYEMFKGCKELTTIYCDDDWNREGMKSNDMFKDCAKLKGAAAYDGSKTDVTMANPTTGYFTKKGATAIQQTVADDVAARKQDIYNLNGVRMGNDLDRLPKGVYIVNGKKVVKR